jgi:glycosyltransferase involved in cell wall biosynthesis
MTNPPKVIVFSITYNCEDVLPFYLRHYSTFAEEIAVFDDFSTDSTRELLKANPKVNLRDWPHPGSGINEDLFLQHWQEWYPKARGHFDWCIIVDPDEIIFHPQILEALAAAKENDIEVIRPQGYNMTGDGLPKDDGETQIWRLSPMGVMAPVYSKPVIFQPRIKINWIRGKHDIENCAPVMIGDSTFKLLHYRYMGQEYTAAKNAKNYARCGLQNGDKGAAWSCAPNYVGEHSASWAEKAKMRAANVVGV